MSRINETFTPEYLAMREQLEQTERIQALSVKLVRATKINQDLLREILEEVLDSYFNLEERTIQAMRLNRNYASDIISLEGRLRQMELRLLADAVHQKQPSGASGDRIVPLTTEF